MASLTPHTRVLARKAEIQSNLRLRSKIIQLGRATLTRGDCLEPFLLREWVDGIEVDPIPMCRAHADNNFSFSFKQYSHHLIMGQKILFTCPHAHDCTLD